MEGLAALQEIQIQLSFAGLNGDLFKLAKDSDGNSSIILICDVVNDISKWSG